MSVVPSGSDQHDPSHFDYRLCELDDRMRRDDEDSLNRPRSNKNLCLTAEHGGKRHGGNLLDGVGI